MTSERRHKRSLLVDRVSNERVYLNMLYRVNSNIIKASGIGSVTLWLHVDYRKRKADFTSDAAWLLINKSTVVLRIHRPKTKGMQHIGVHSPSCWVCLVVTAGQLTLVTQLQTKNKQEPEKCSREAISSWSEAIESSRKEDVFVIEMHNLKGLRKKLWVYAIKRLCLGNLGASSGKQQFAES